MSKKRTKKTDKPSTPPEVLAKSGHWSDWMAPEAFRLYPEKDGWRKRLMLTMLMWYDEKDEQEQPVLDIIDFCIKYKIPPRSLRRYKLKFEDIQEIYNDVKELLGYRRKIGALRRTLDKDAVYKDMHKYDPEWDEINKYHAALKTAEAQNETKIVVLEKMPSSPLVPEKK